MPLVATKLRPPAPRRRLVPRETLRAALDATEARVVLVSAPAGYGKSTVLAEWLAAQGLPCGWLSLDAGDNDPVRFLRYLRAAAVLAAGGTLQAGGEAADDADLLLAETLEALGAGEDDGHNSTGGGGAARAGRRRVVVLDDYHLIETRAIHDAVALLVERLPDRAIVAIATRADPPLPIARLRARGELLELRAADLRFSAADAATLLRDRAGGLSEASVASLADRTEGWPAALQLAALALEGRPDADEVVDRFGASHRFILDYVADEVLAGLDPDLHEFLLETSVLERLCGDLCDVVTGLPGGAERLRRIEEANLLIAPLDDERRWYRYHALFADMLHARLVAARPDLEPELHARAAGWLDSHGDPDAAFDHAVRGGDLGRAIRIFRERWPGLTHGGELGAVRRWLEMLPPDVVRNDAQLSAAFAWLLMLTGEVRGVREWLDDADAALAAPDVEAVDRLVVPTQVASLRSRLALLDGDPAAAVAHARRAIAVVPDSLPPSERTLFRGDGTLMLGHALRESGDPGAAADAYAAALPLLREGGNWIAAGYCVTSLAGLRIRSGDSSGALELCEKTLADPGGSPARALAAVRVALAEAHLALGSIERARHEAELAAALARRAGQAATLRNAESLLGRMGPAAAPNGRAGAEPAGGGAIGRAVPGPTAANRRLVEPLTARELEVLRLVALGRSNRQIAAELFVTLGTAKVHVHSIAQKLGAANRVEAIVRARKVGLLDPLDPLD